MLFLWCGVGPEKKKKITVSIYTRNPVLGDRGLEGK